MRLFLLAFLCVLAFSPSFAKAQTTGTYAGIGIGGWDKRETGTYSSNDYSTILNAYSGLRASVFRVQFNVSQWDNATREGFTGSFTSLGVDAYVHAMQGSFLSPFVGVGYGYLFADEGNAQYYALMGGLAIAPRYSPIGVNIEYRRMKPRRKIEGHDFTGAAYIFNIFYNF